MNQRLPPASFAPYRLTRARVPSGVAAPTAVTARSEAGNAIVSGGILFRALPVGDTITTPFLYAFVNDAATMSLKSSFRPSLSTSYDQLMLTTRRPPPTRAWAI